MCQLVVYVKKIGIVTTGVPQPMMTASGSGGKAVDAADTASNAGSNAGSVAISAAGSNATARAAHVKEMRDLLKRTLAKAEDGLNSEIQQLDERLASKRASRNGSRLALTSF